MYHLRTTEWPRGTVWEALATAKPIAPAASCKADLSDAKQQLHQKPLLRSFPFTWLARILYGLRAEWLRVQRVLEAAVEAN